MNLQVELPLNKDDGNNFRDILFYRKTVKFNPDWDQSLFVKTRLK